MKFLFCYFYTLVIIVPGIALFGDDFKNVGSGIVGNHVGNDVGITLFNVAYIIVLSGMGEEHYQFFLVCFHICICFFISSLNSTAKLTIISIIKVSQNRAELSQFYQIKQIPTRNCLIAVSFIAIKFGFISFSYYICAKV